MNLRCPRCNHWIDPNLPACLSCGRPIPAGTATSLPKTKPKKRNPLGKRAKPINRNNDPTAS